MTRVDINNYQKLNHFNSLNAVNIYWIISLYSWNMKNIVVR